MESKKNKLSQEIFATESIWRLMAKMCVPAVLTILIMVLYNMADIYFIGQTGDSYKVTFRQSLLRHPQALPMRS